MKELNEFEAHLNKIVRPVLKDTETEGTLDDLGLRGHGSELDQDEKLGKGYDQDPMFIQLGKVIDSGKDGTVTTDDGKSHKVSVDQARTIRMLMTTEKVKPMVRTKFQKDMQTSHGLVDFLDMDYHELPSLFVKRYLG
jgi:hypothetical protein